MNDYKLRADTIAALAEKFAPAEKKEVVGRVEISSLWVDVRDRLPNEEERKRYNGRFLVCREDGGIFIDEFKGMTPSSKSGSWIVLETSQVVAWMNLPDVYEAPER